MGTPMLEERATAARSVRTRSMLNRRCFVLALLGFLVAAPASAGKPAIEGVVNLNTASEAELELLPGIGAAKARAIVEYRKAHPFRTAEELVRIKGIGRKMMRKLRPHLAISGPTTARAVPANAKAKEAQPAE
jgi:competence protein ComEA